MDVTLRSDSASVVDRTEGNLALAATQITGNPHNLIVDGEYRAGATGDTVPGNRSGGKT